MSEPTFDAAGRQWTFDGWSPGDTQKSWSTRSNGEPVEMVASDDDGWILRRVGQQDVPTHHTTLYRAIAAVQAILDEGGELTPWVPSTEEVRDDYSVRDPQVYGPAFDRWLAAHDEELIRALTSVANAMESA